MKKYFIINIAIILIIFFVGLFYTHIYSNNISFGVEMDNKKVNISAYILEGNYYLFLPGNVAVDDVSTNQPLNINGQKFSTGDRLNLSLGNYHIKVNGADRHLIITQGSKIPVMYIETATGLVDEIKEKEKNPVNISIYDGYGNLNYSSNIEIKGRGNTTWDNFDKKSFNIYLPEKCSILGLGNFDRFVLLANSYDQTNLKNKIALDLAKIIGGGWTPDSVYTELYINSEYQGLYLLCEKVEGENLGLDDDDYLIQSTFRKKKNESNILTDGRETFLVNSGSTNDDDLDKLQKYLSDIEGNILDGTYSSSLDLDSFSKKLLLEEIVGNNDMQSFYFYTKDGVLYSGPAWDYDLSATDTESSVIFSHRRFSWYNEALYNEYIRQALKDNYSKHRELFISIISDYDAYQSVIYDSSTMNSIRWEECYDVSLDASFENLKIFYNNHIAYVDDFFNNYFDNYLVRILNEGMDADYLLYANDDGIVDFSLICDEGSTLINVENGEIVDTSKPITCNTTVRKITQNKKSIVKILLSNKRMVFYLGILCIFLFSMSVIIICDIGRYKR